MSLYLRLGGAGCLAAGSFLPWAKVIAPFVGTVTKSGIDGGDGWLTLAAGAVIALLVGQRRAPRFVVLVGALALALVIYEIADIRHKFAGVNSEFVSTSIGGGLYLCGLGAAAAVAGAVIANRELREDS